eukprot:s5008_g1.t1
MELARDPMMDSFTAPGDGYSTTNAGMQTVDNAARWRLVWCYHSCFKSDCEHLRASLMAEVKARGGVVQMMKQVKHLEQWLLKPMDKTCSDYVILTSWRHLKPLWNSLLNIQIEELELKRSLPAAIYVYAEETVSYERASAWVFENNLQDVIFVLPNLTPQLAGSFVDEFLTKIEAGRANLPITSSAASPWQDYQTVYSSMDTWEPYSMYSTPSPYVESHECSESGGDLTDRRTASGMESAVRQAMSCCCLTSGQAAAHQLSYDSHRPVDFDSPWPLPAPPPPSAGEAQQTWRSSSRHSTDFGRHTQCYPSGSTQVGRLTLPPACLRRWQMRRHAMLWPPRQRTAAKVSGFTPPASLLHSEKCKIAT